MSGSSGGSWRTHDAVDYIYYQLRQCNDLNGFVGLCNNMRTTIQNYVDRNNWTLIDCNAGNPDEKATSGYWERVFNKLERK